ncbi:hypothetical protein HWC53_gp175 [Bacillus phage vB_BmeM-Goe8]|uniref:Uncharacterized protein n=1 Tax=Bacillus phage vB_BmeM-Goe8 TaxID=2593638 RepID=A0A516KMU9_9CAUD|nr:hypothetical protein HWC53_gp175 [Bacillus phage vB_BmeM-Goe8]QDP42914.1 hypothetical protein Goe8_c01410 [Bacillus phage vB_BmeM-Goe8]
MEQNINDFVGAFGVTTDENFGQITSLLAEQGKVLKEEEAYAKTPKAKTELITTYYQVEDKIYRLWYQVKTPHASKGAALAFSFDKMPADFKL